MSWQCPGIFLGSPLRTGDGCLTNCSSTQIWPLLKERTDTAPLLFPRTSDIQFTAQIILDKINWPTHDDEEDIEVSLEDTCRVSRFLRTFIENASSKQLEKLVQFWLGWNVVPRSLDVEVVENSFPKSSTCFHLLKLPRHYTEYSSFKTDIIAAISTVDTGFGMI
ncbi:hypothetical protein ATANTOWER_029544 [Ataeniobius toweri]|uniref:HECT domain-containing protein n=1 Tax=Ataeniobius toweri TaxID=208326 RepID=A0ABU7A9G2_9TELE|nr:hypothetical protein [Ataeniobius toweri]